MLRILNRGNIIAKMKIGSVYAAFTVGLSEHPDKKEIRNYIKVNPNLSIAPEVEEKKKEKKKRRGDKKKSAPKLELKDEGKLEDLSLNTKEKR
jgi:phage terminase large subunit-like protein